MDVILVRCLWTNKARLRGAGPEAGFLPWARKVTG